MSTHHHEGDNTMTKFKKAILIASLTFGTFAALNTEASAAGYSIRVNTKGYTLVNPETGQSEAFPDEAGRKGMLYGRVSAREVFTYAGECEVLRLSKGAGQRVLVECLNPVD
jgi:hypothetical protein